MCDDLNAHLLSPHHLHTQLCRTPSSATPSFTHQFATHHLSHTTLSPTIFDTPSFTHTFVTHTHTICLCHTPSFIHNFVTHNFVLLPCSTTSFVFPYWQTLSCRVSGSLIFYGIQTESGANSPSMLCQFRPPNAPTLKNHFSMETGEAFFFAVFFLSWLLVAPGGSWWLLVAPGGSWWLWWLLVAPGGSWWLLVAPGGSWWLLVAPGVWSAECKVRSAECKVWSVE